MNVGTEIGKVIDQRGGKWLRQLFAGTPIAGPERIDEEPDAKVLDACVSIAKAHEDAETHGDSAAVEAAGAKLDEITGPTSRH